MPLPAVRVTIGGVDVTFSDGAEVVVGRGPDAGISSLDLGALLGIWRTETYHNAEKLIAAPTPAARRRVAAEIEASAAQRARLIGVATSYAVLCGSSIARDRFCTRQAA
jgi:hypothetical protein